MVQEFSRMFFCVFLYNWMFLVGFLDVLEVPRVWVSGTLRGFSRECYVHISIFSIKKSQRPDMDPRLAIDSYTS